MNRFTRFESVVAKRWAPPAIVLICLSSSGTAPTRVSTETSCTREKTARGRTIDEAVSPVLQRPFRADRLVERAAKQEDRAPHRLEDLWRRRFPPKPSEELIDPEHVVARAVCSAMM